MQKRGRKLSPVDKIEGPLVIVPVRTCIQNIF